MNVHPFLVHFPIALLIVYALLELVRIKHFKTPHAVFTKGLLVITGTVAAFLASSTGEMIEGQFRSVHNLVETHAFFATLSQVTFTLLALAYLIKLIQQFPKIEEKIKNVPGKIWDLFLWYEKFILQAWVVVPLAIIGIVLICLAGALGAAVAHGPDVDPFVRFAYDLFF